ncbi:hypothetical protein IFR05_000789 [Cadophora sp. M221]|nr:hypothetical protein IFR05_000789 [Cadophora sp. M221]
MALCTSVLTEEASIYSNLPLLHPKLIRILTILPGEIGDIIECTLEVVNLDEKPDYEALSYCWGRTSPPVTVICNKQCVSVTPNLGAALQHLRYPKGGTISKFRESLTLGKSGKPEGRRRLWIDALCINQQDLEGRSKITTEQDYLERGDLPALDNEIWDAVNFFYENVWFRRIWVVQEAARADARVIMGAHEVSLFDVCIASEWMAKEKDMATDPRDNIYALLGLYSSWARLGGKAKPSFKPDYTKTTPEVYGDLVRYFLTLERGDDDEEGSLRIMLRDEAVVSQGELAVEAENNEVDSDFPSWVPRWDLCRHPWVGFSRWRRGNKWFPSGESPITIGDAKDSTILSLKGFAISTIDFLKRESELPSPRLASDGTSLQTTLDEVLTRPSIYAGNDSIKLAFAQTLTAGMSKNPTNFVP